MNPKTLNKLGLTAAVGALALPLAAQQRPNVLVIMTDQQRTDLCAREGFPLDLTPYVDRLASQNIWCNRAYTTVPASAPARASMLTGRWPSATRTRTNHNIADNYAQDNMVHQLREAGYATAMIGKNHSFLNQGDFDFWTSYSHWGKDKKDLPGTVEMARFLNKESWGQYLPPSPQPLEHQNPYLIVNEALQWMGARKEPFFAWVSFPEPHNPYQVCEPYYSMFPPETLPPCATGLEALPKKGEKFVTLGHLLARAHVNDPQNLNRVRANYYGMIRLIDDQIQRLIEALKESGQYENTLIVILADHGDYAGEYGLMKKGAGVPEVLTRIPMIWAGYGIAPRKAPLDAHVSIADVYPTVCEAANLPIPMGVQGRSLWPLLQGKKAPAREFQSMLVEQGFGGEDVFMADSVFMTFQQEGCLQPRRIAAMDELNTWSQSGSRRGVRKGDWKIVMDGYGRGELYNLVKDPFEVNNLYGKRKYAKQQVEMLEELNLWQLRVQDPLPVPHHRYFFKRYPHNYHFPERESTETNLYSKPQ